MNYLGNIFLILSGAFLGALGQGYKKIGYWIIVIVTYLLIICSIICREG